MECFLIPKNLQLHWDRREKLASISSINVLSVFKAWLFSIYCSLCGALQYFLLQSTHHPPTCLLCHVIMFYPIRICGWLLVFFFFLNPLWLWLPCPAVLSAEFTSHYKMQKGLPLHFLLCALCTSQFASLYPSMHNSWESNSKIFASKGLLLFFPSPLYGCILFPSKVYCMWHIRIYLSISLFKKQCYTTYMVLFLHFRLYTERKTPLLRNHSICSGPQRFSPVLIILNSTVLTFKVRT